MTEREQLIALCERLGAPAAQAGVFADQLSKRADQLARERGITRVEAMESLIRLVIQARRGDWPPPPEK